MTDFNLIKEGHETWHGIYPIVITPFTKDLELDEPSLRNVVRFCIESGAHGMVGPANASEFSTLSDDERNRWVEIVVSESSNQIPVIASVTSGHIIPALSLANHAQKIGVQGVMAMPPHILHLGMDQCFYFYKELSEGIDVPICVQNCNGPVGTPMTAELLARMCNELENVEYIKEETTPEPQRISQVITAAGKGCKGVMGGQGGMYLINEYKRGVAGSMPACHTVDVFVKLWNLLEVSDHKQASALFHRMLPLIIHERLYGVSVYKEILCRRGIIRSPTVRAPGNRLVGEYDFTELDQALSGIESIF